MTSENIGANEDLELNAADADSVVGGKKKAKKKVVAKKKQPATHPAQAATAMGTTIGPPMTQAEMDAYDKDMIDHGLDAVYGTTPSE